ncbi:MAG TPA: M20/M25/M40 family metallo-hydrolase [Vicinamibacteria bacterium]|nr:M20/M25/M40 family metallo-hydrolase [Vicinamibacteria bacterium]
MAITRPQLERFASSQRARYEELLADLVGVRSVSADPAHQSDIERCAELGAATIRAFGGRAELHRVPGGNPIVLGSFDAGPGRPTVTVYNHLDVQPASRETEPWRTEPFTLSQQGDTYFGRGTTDDKGPALAALFGARAALDAGVPINIKFLWELEEEVGSPHFADTLKKIGPAAATDAVVVSDTVWVSRGRPSLSAGLRGLQRITFHLETAETDQHSGTTGGAARNPVGELAQLVGEIMDARTGRVKIPGFYEDVEKLTKQQLADFRAAGFSVKGFVKDHGFKSIRTKDPLQVMKSLWAMPTFEVHGLVGGYTGPGVKTIVPPRAELKASVRLVPNMKGEKIVRLVKAFVKKRNPDVRVVAGSCAAPYKGLTTGPHVEATRRSLSFAFGKDPVFVREGGTIGAVLSMEQILKCPIVFMGLSLPDHGYHAPNENFDWGQAGGGMMAFAKFFEEVAAQAR